MGSVRRYLLAAAGLVAAAGCAIMEQQEFERLSSREAFLLGEGDVTQGRVTFVALRCHFCHTVDRLTFPEAPSPLKAKVPLGGEVDQIPSEGELATAIINPSHDLPPEYTSDTVTAQGESRMLDYGDVVTLRQLKDLVAFLQTRYRRRPAR